MKKLFPLLLGWVFLFSACSPVAGVPSATATLTMPPTAEATTVVISPTPAPFFSLFSADPIVAKGQQGAWDDRFTDPGAVIYHNGVFHMFRNGFRDFPGTSQVGYVTSPDGFTWKKQGEKPVFKTADVPFAKIAMYASSVLVEDDGTWILYFYTWDQRSFPSSGVIGRATAPAPEGPWVADDDPVLLPGPVHAWDGRQVLAPHVIKTESGYVMYYSGSNFNGDQKIGMATSEDGLHWTKFNDPATGEELYIESDPVLFNGDASSWDASWVHQPRVFQTDEGWLMIYRGTRIGGTNMALGIATSADGIHWKKSALNPVFIPSDIPRATEFWFHNVLLVDGTYFLFVEGDVNKRTQIYLLTRPADRP